MYSKTSTVYLQFGYTPPRYRPWVGMRVEAWCETRATPLLFLLCATSALYIIIACTSQHRFKLYRASWTEPHYPLPGVGCNTTPTEAQWLGYVHFAFGVPYPDPHYLAIKCLDAHISVSFPIIACARHAVTTMGSYAGVPFGR